MAKINAVRSPYASTQVSGGSWSIAAEASNAIAATLQLRGPDGKNLAQRVSVPIWVTATADPGPIVPTAPTGGLAVTGGSVLSVLTAGKHVVAVTNATGALTVTLTDTGTPTFRLHAQLPDGTVVTSGAITFA